MLTYGEALQAVKDSKVLVKGRWRSIPMPTHRERMPEREAMDYYNAKLYKYWLTQMDWIVPTRKEQVLRYLLGRPKKAPKT